LRNIVIAAHPRPFIRTFIGLFQRMSVFLVCLFSFSSSFAQRPNLSTLGNQFGGSSSQSQPRAAKVKKDTIVSVIPDSLRSKDSQLTTTVEYTANDSTILDVDKKTVYLFGNAIVSYGDIELKADYIKLDWGKNEVYAHGMPDSTRKTGPKVKGKPIFSQGNEAYNTDTIRYNFKSKKAIIKGIVTQQGDGFVQGKKVKKDSVDNLYLVDALYTTCNLSHPHFHIAAKKLKLVEKKSVISGPFRLVIADIPLPIGLPFGFFPVPKNKEGGTTGFLMGQYGEDPNSRGFYFKDFGYYFAISENIGVKVLADIYSRGSWGMGIQSQYIKKYRYSGNLNLQFNRNVLDNIAKEEKEGSNDFNISWSHSPQSRRPDRSFSSSVNFVSNKFNQNNVNTNAAAYTNNAFRSSVQYSRSFGKLIRTSAGINADQNTTSKVLNASANFTAGLNQFNPFVKEEDQTGRWFESFRVGLDISSGYTTTNNLTGLTRSTTFTEYTVYGVENKPLTDAELKEEAIGLTSYQKILELNSLDAFKELLSRGKFRTNYSLPIALPNFKIARFINLTPSVSLRGDVFNEKLDYTFYSENSTHTRPNGEVVSLKNIDPAIGAIVIDTTRGLFPTFYVSTGVSMNTRIYNTKQFSGKNRLQAVRYTLAPSIGASFTPDQTNSYFKKTRYRNDTSATKYLPIFADLNSVAGASGVLTFGMTYQLEAKLRAKSDTAEKQFQKISLLDNVNISSGYNLLGMLNDQGKTLAEKVNPYYLQPVTIGGATRLFKDLINLNFNTTLDPYAYSADKTNTANLAGIRTPTFKKIFGGDKNTQGSLFPSYTFSISTRLSPETFLPETKQKSKNTGDPVLDAMERTVEADPLRYVDFEIPWSVNLSFNYNKNRQGLAASRLTSAVQIQGDFSLTPKWKFTYSTGYDLNFKEITLTNLGVVRDLHCWEMRFDWTPISGNIYRSGSYSFQINVKSSLLKDLKLRRARQRSGFGN
jgi:lipopolysaccharide assembly outer membrane protein LptD (OstA)